MKRWFVSGRRMQILFLFYGTVFSLLLVFRLPPLMGADEPNHLRRANLLAQGSLVGKRMGAGATLSSGGTEETNLNDFEAIMAPMEFHPEVKVGEVDLAKARMLPWGDRQAYQPFENTAIYPPFFYLPAALGVFIGKTTHLSIMNSVTLARLANAMVCVACGFFGLEVARRGREILFTLLLLPMSVGLYSTVTQDGLLLTTAALACAWLVRAAAEGRPMTRREVWKTGIALALVGMGKPPYLLLSLLLPVVGTRPRKWGWFGAMGSLLTALTWHLAMAVTTQTPMKRAGIKLDPGKQVRFLFEHPLSTLGIVVSSLRHSGGEYYAQFIGVLGWLDTVLPKGYYVAAGVALALSGWLGFSLQKSGDRSRALLSCAVLALTAAAVFVALYVAYTPVGAAEVEGVQGRYFLPIAMFLPLLVVGQGQRVGKPWARKLGLGLLAALPAVSILVVERALTTRFY
jgi:uncharacterized membrane protein